VDRVGNTVINTEQPGRIACAGLHDNLRSNAIRHTVDALASRGDEGRGKLR
jgi:hypothetical protein